MTVPRSNARPSPVAILPRAKERVAIVRLEGVVRKDAVEAADHTILSADENVRGMVVDLTAAQHLDYHAVSILARRRRVLRAKGRELAVAAAVADVRHVVRAVAASDVPVFPTLEQAIAWVRGESEDMVAAGARTRGRARTR